MSMSEKVTALATRLAAVIVSMTNAINSRMPLIGGKFTGPVGFAAEVDAGSGGAITVDFKNGQKQRCTLTSATPTISFMVAPAVGHYQLRVIQDATGGRTPSYAGISALRWLGTAAVPAVNGNANSESIISLYWDGARYTQSMAKVGAV